MSDPYRVVLADDHNLVRSGLKRLLDEIPDLQVTGEAADGLELLRVVRKQKPQLVILDLSMPKMRGVEAIKELKQARSDLKILVLTMHAEEHLYFEAISAGADGYLLKDDAEKELFEAVDCISKGKVFISPRFREQSLENWIHLRRNQGRSSERLTTREREVLKLLAGGKANREIGDLLNISVRTVEQHRANMMAKLRVHTVAELVRYALRKRID